MARKNRKNGKKKNGRPDPNTIVIELNEVKEGADEGLGVGREYEFRMVAAHESLLQYGDIRRFSYTAKDGSKLNYEGIVVGREGEGEEPGFIIKVRRQITKGDIDACGKPVFNLTDILVNGIVASGSSVYVPRDSIPDNYFSRSFVAQSGDESYIARARAQHGGRKAILTFGEKL